MKIALPRSTDEANMDFTAQPEAAASVSSKLTRAALRRSALIAGWSGATNAFRLVNSGADGLEGITVDVLDSCLLVEQHRRETPVQPVISALTELYPDAPLFLKYRWSHRSEDRAGEQVAGPFAAPNLEVRENGLRYWVRLSDEEHIGLFLDSRRPREWVRANSEQKRVLNLFSYTGGFGMAAAAGGAKSTVNIDNKSSALQFARQNYERNGLAVDQRTFFQCDVLYYLKRAAQQRGRFDLIVVDPPPRFKRRKQRDFMAHRDYGRMLSMCVRVLAPSGIVFAGLNALKADDEQMRHLIHEAGELAQVSFCIRETITADDDFPLAVDRPSARFAVLDVAAE